MGKLRRRASGRIIQPPRFSVNCTFAVLVSRPRSASRKLGIKETQATCTKMPPVAHPP